MGVVFSRVDNFDHPMFEMCFSMSRISVGCCCCFFFLHSMLLLSFDLEWMKLIRLEKWDFWPKIHCYRKVNGNPEEIIKLFSAIDSGTWRGNTEESVAFVLLEHNILFDSILFVSFFFVSLYHSAFYTWLHFMLFSSVLCIVMNTRKRKGTIQIYKNI